VTYKHDKSNLLNHTRVMWEGDGMEEAEIPVVEEEMHVNEEAFADRVFEAFQEVMKIGPARLS